MRVFLFQGEFAARDSFSALRRWLNLQLLNPSRPADSPLRQISVPGSGHCCRRRNYLRPEFTLLDGQRRIGCKIFGIRSNMDLGQSKAKQSKSVLVALTENTGWRRAFRVAASDGSPKDQFKALGDSTWTLQCRSISCVCCSLLLLKSPTRNYMGRFGCSASAEANMLTVTMVAHALIVRLKTPRSAEPSHPKCLEGRRCDDRSC